METDPRDPSAPSTHALDDLMADFSRVPSGLDPIQVRACLSRLIKKLEAAEAQARIRSPEVVIETTTREMARLLQQARAAAERSHAEVVQEAQHEAIQVRAEARAEAARLTEEARSESERFASFYLEEVRREARQQGETELEQIRQRAAGELLAALERAEKLLDAAQAGANEELQRLEQASATVTTLAHALTARRTRPPAPPTEPAQVVAEPAPAETPVEEVAAEPSTVVAPVVEPRRPEAVNGSAPESGDEAPSGRPRGWFKLPRWLDS